MNKYLNKYLRSSILLLMFCTSLTACASAGEEYLFDAAAKQQAGETSVKETSTQTLILTTSALEGSTAHRTAVKFKSYVEEEFGDRFEVAIYPNDTLGKLDNAIPSLQSGAVDIRVGVPNTKVGGAILWAPSLTDVSLERLNELLQGGELRTLLEEGCQDNGSILLSVFPAHYRVVTSKEKVQEPADFSRVIMRTISGTGAEAAYWQSLGVYIHSMDLRQVNNALQMGIVNSQENPLSITVSYGIEKNQNYVIDVRHKIYFDSLQVSETFWDSLKEEDQKRFIEIAQKTEEYAERVENEEESLDRDILIQQGLEWVELPDETRRWMRETGGTAAEQSLRASNGDEWMDNLLAILNS
ncbi:MAG: TRAP transporter substrate-binding protein [Lachnospiraceae bacterium]